MTVGVGGSDFATELAGIRNGRHAVPPIGAEEHARRVERAQARMRELGIAALWLDGTTNLAWLTGLKHGQSERPVGALLPDEGRPDFKVRIGAAADVVDRGLRHHLPAVPETVVAQHLAESRQVAQAAVEAATGELGAGAVDHQVAVLLDTEL